MSTRHLTKLRRASFKPPDWHFTIYRASRALVSSSALYFRLSRWYYRVFISCVTAFRVRRELTTIHFDRTVCQCVTFAASESLVQHELTTKTGVMPLISLMSTTGLVSHECWSHLAMDSTIIGRVLVGCRLSASWTKWAQHQHSHLTWNRRIFVTMYTFKWFQ